MLLMLAALAAAPQPRYAGYQRAIENTPPAQLQTCAPLDALTYSHAAASLADLRLYAHGRETPYTVRLAEPAIAPAKKIAPLNLGEQRGKIIFDAAMTGDIYNDIDLDVQAHDFIAIVEVFGSQSPHGEATHLGGFTIFDFARQKLGRSTVLHLPPSDFRYLHFQIDGPLQPQDITGLTLSQAREAGAEYVLAAEGSQPTEKDKQTLITFTLPANVPVDRVEFLANPANFSRDVTVTVTPQKPLESTGKESADEDPAQEVEPITFSGSLLRIHGIHNGHRIDQEHLSVEAPSYDTRLAGRSLPTHWLVKIDNGDDPPLALQSVRLQMLQRSLCFDAAPGVGYVLRYGDPALTAPRYDYATLFTPEQDAAHAILGPEQQNPGYQPRPDDRPFTERHPMLLWVCLLVVVFVLGAVMLRSARQIQR
jgi:hypothetical protein